MEIDTIETQIVEEFNVFDDWMDKYNYLIDAGKALNLINEKYKDLNHLISGCQSRVWLHAQYDNGRVQFFADSDAVITKGLINLLIRVLNNQKPADIIEAKLQFVDTIGLKEHLSPTRSNGLMSMIKHMKLYAMAFKAKEDAKQQES